MIFKHLPPVTQHFLRDFLPDKRKQEQEHNAVDRKDKAGPVVTVWVHNHKNADSITLVEDNLGKSSISVFPRFRFYRWHPSIFSLTVTQIFFSWCSASNFLNFHPATSSFVLSS